MVKGLLAKELLTGLVLGGVLLLLVAGFLGLAKLVDPAVAALAVGGTVLAAVGLLGWRIGRPD